MFNPEGWHYRVLPACVRYAGKTDTVLLREGWTHAEITELAAQWEIDQEKWAKIAAVNPLAALIGG